MKKRGRPKFGLTLVIVAALLLEMISGIQYYYMHDILTDELEKHAETEMTMKVILTKGTLNMAENSLRGHIWDIKRNLPHADSMYTALERVLRSHPNLQACAIAFTADYYKEKGRLFEPCAYWEGEKVAKIQVADEARHDYTQNPNFIDACQNEKNFWTDPYHDAVSKKETVTYSHPIHEDGGRLAGIFQLDMALDWLGDTLNHRQIFPSSFSVLLTEGGEKIAGPKEKHSKREDVETVINLINDSTIEKPESKTGRTRTFTFASVNGDKGIVFYRSFKGNPHWQIAMVYYEDEIFGTLRQVRVNILLMMLVGFTFLGFIIWRFFKNEKALQETRLRQAHINSELRIAQGIQQEMLPKVFPPYPERKDIDIYGSLVPAKAVGGDLFDFFLRDEKLFFCIGDVSGKGVPSALVMAMTHAHFRLAAAHENSPARLMMCINEAACMNNESNMFVTFFIGVLDLPTGRLRYCNAGHDVPQLITPTDHGPAITDLPVSPNLPIGVFGDMKYEVEEYTLTPGTTLFLYTDGLTEAKNKRHEQFGAERMRRSLLTDDGMQQLVASMTEAVHQFVEDAEQSDDLTQLAIRYTPQEEADLLFDRIELTNDVSQVKQLSQFMTGFCSRLPLEAAVAKQLRLAVEEAVVNVMDYAYPIGQQGRITIEAKQSARQVRFIISDSGVQFDPTETLKADTTLSAEDRPIGGLGILLVRELMDTINYERIDGKNVLTLSKDIAQR